MPTSNIDDLLMGVGNSQQPTTPEHKEKVEEKAPIEEMESDESENTQYEEDEAGGEDNESESPEEDVSNIDSDKKDSKDAVEEAEDEYGNKKELMSKRMKERLDKKEKQHQREIEQRETELQQLRQQLVNQGANSQVQKATEDFKYNPNDEGSWQEQLTDFVKHTVTNMQSEQNKKDRATEEQHAEREFHKKFSQGMNRFDDFREIVGSQPIDDAMTLSLRGMSDPSAFIYAASKRQPGELERISKMKDPYVRMVEMGKLEERMRRNKLTTKAPRPLGRAREDATTKVQPKQKDTSGDDLLAKSDAKRLATVKTRHKVNR